MKHSENKFIGHDGFIWWFGKVEKRDDPLSLGRVRVRIFGTHPDDKILVPDDSLPWAFPIQPITSSGAYGVGSTAVGPIPGSHVFGFWLDGHEKQIPVFLGVISGGTGQFTFGEALGNLATSAGNAVKDIVDKASNLVLPASSSQIETAVSCAKLLMTTFG